MIYNDELFQNSVKYVKACFFSHSCVISKSLHFDSSNMPSTISFTSETVEAAQLQYVLHLAASYENGSSGREKI